ncbi:uncharacterized protein prr14 [Festucalex cinctus]
MRFRTCQSTRDVGRRLANIGVRESRAMLTFPSNSLRHLVFPMDGDAMPPHPFCSALPHNEPPPPPPLLPLPSVTSRARDGASGHRRSRRIQAVKPQSTQVEEMVQTPSTYNPSSFKRHGNNMLQVSQGKQPRVESIYEDDERKQDGRDSNTAAEFQNTGKDFAKEDDHLLERSDRMPEHEAPSCAVNVSASAPTGWLMGPFFQSFKSKMASFTEIVMSPVKLFKEKNLVTPEVQPDKVDESLEATWEPRDNGKQEEKESLLTLALQPGSGSHCSRKLFNTSSDEIQVPLPSSQEVPLLQEHKVNTADVIEEAKVSTQLKNPRPTKPNVEKSPALRSCHVLLSTTRVDATHHETKSDLVRSKRTLSTRVRVERKRLKSETKNDVAEPPPLKQKVLSTVSDVQEDLKPATRCRNVKREVEADEQSGGGAQMTVPLGNAVAVRKRQSLLPTQPPSSVPPLAPAGVAMQSKDAPKVGRSRPVKRPKKDPRGGLQAQTKKTKTKLGQAHTSTEPLYFEMTPFEGNQSECSEPNQNGDQDASRLRNRRVSRKQPRGGPRSRGSRFGHTPNGTTSATVEDLPTSAGKSVSPRHLLRSYSCPEIPSLVASLPHQPPLASVPVRFAGDLRRARRHTVSSVEVEREIAPLCLRKEVYPSRRSFPCDGQNLPPVLLPRSSMAALASCFLSSPLAFLSGRGEGRAAAAGNAASSHAVFLPASSPKTDSSFGAPDDCVSVLNSANLLAGGTDRGVPSEDDEDTGSSCHEFDKATATQREEKSLSDSELKVAQKHERHGKVSSIRIRRSLPKPQNNLTPMGLPKAVRLKKKQFSLEEIYTNKNYSKPPESRLETILEAPLSRRDGSESYFGQRRLKRYMAFLEVGEARKPKKVLAGGGKTGAASSRTRRGGFATSDDDPSLMPPPDIDSLLCAKMKQLDLWLIADQADAAC